MAAVIICSDFGSEGVIADMKSKEMGAHLVGRNVCLCVCVCVCVYDSKKGGKVGWSCSRATFIQALGKEKSCSEEIHLNTSFNGSPLPQGERPHSGMR